MCVEFYIFEHSKLMMTTNNNFILITGATGFIGSHTVVALHEKGFIPILLDNYSNSEPIVLEALEKICGKKFIFFQGDCRDVNIYNQIYEQYPFNSVIHFAAFKAVGESVEKPIAYFDNNLTSTITLLNALKELGVKNLIFSSSCTVYGSPELSMVTEQTPYGEAESPYGYTKLVCEQMIQQTVNYGQPFSAVLLRYFNPIGAHESGLLGEKPVGVPNNLVPYITQTAKGLRECLSVFGDDYPTPDGSCIRDFIHVMDVAEAHVAALNFILKQDGLAVHTFNVGTGKGTSVLQAIQAFEDANDMKINWKIAPRRPGDVVKIFANTDYVESTLNWKAKRTINEAMKDAWKWEQNID
jgi:UDP-glucose 4-epimerase